MAISNFILKVNFSEKELGSNFSIQDVGIKLWLKGKQNDELLGQTIGNDPKKQISYRFSYDLGVEANLIIYLEIEKEGIIIPYKLLPSNNLESTITPGTTTLNAELDLPERLISDINSEFKMEAMLLDLDGNAYQSLQVETEIKRLSEIIQTGFTSFTNPIGLFPITFKLNKRLRGLMDAKDEDLSFKFTFFRGSKELGSHSIMFSTITDFSKWLVMNVDLTSTTEIISESIDSLSNTIGLTIPSELQTVLETNSISTLRNIRAIGGLMRLPELSTPELSTAVETAKKLDSHAQFETVAGDFKSNNNIIQNGFDSIYKVALTPSHLFVQKVTDHENTNEYKAALFHRVAVSQHNMYVGIANNLKLEGQESINGLYNLTSDDCDCDDCEAAVSPLAYLADLLWYSENHLRMQFVSTIPVGYSNGMVTKEQLDFIFFQPFSQLPFNCESVHGRICQYRIAIEVLAAYAQNISYDEGSCLITEFQKAEKRFLTNAYHELLQGFGTSFSEIREVYLTPEPEKLEKAQKLADKLGIVLTHSSVTGYTTDALYLTFSSGSLNHEELERIFGLRNYIRLPLDNSPYFLGNYIPSIASPTGYALPRPLMEIWKEEFLKLRWYNEDRNKDRFWENLNDDYFIDPDILIADDFRSTATSTPGTYNVEDNPAFKIWKNRKIFLNSVWRDLISYETGIDQNFGSSSYHEFIHTAPHGIFPGSRRLEVANDIATNSFLNTGIGKIRIKGSSYQPNNKEYKVLKTTNSGTVVHLNEVVPDPSTIDSVCKIEYLASFPIRSIAPDTGNYSIVIDGNLSNTDLNIGSKIELFGSKFKIYGIYEVIGFNYHAPTDRTKIIVVENILANYPSSPSADDWGNIQFINSSSIVSLVIEKDYLHVDGAISDIDGNTHIHILDSQNNNGKYALDLANFTDSKPLTINSSQNRLLTRINLTDQLPEIEEIGKVSYLKDLINGVEINPEIAGDQKIYIPLTFKDVAGVDVGWLYYFNASSLGAALLIDRVDTLPGKSNYSIASVGNISGNLEITINSGEFLYGNEIGKNLYLTYLVTTDANIIDTGTVDLAPFIDLGIEVYVQRGSNPIEGPFLLNPESTPYNYSFIGGTVADYTGAQLILNFPISIQSIQKLQKFTLNFTGDDPILENFQVGKRFSFIASSNPNQGEYTIQSVSITVPTPPGTTYYSLEIVPVEPILDVSTITANIKCGEAFATIYPSHPLFYEIFNSWNVSGNFNYTDPTSSTISLAPWPSVDTSIADFLNLRTSIQNQLNNSSYSTDLAYIESTYYLTRDSYLRLSEIFQKYQDFLLEKPAAFLPTSEEFEEAFNIMVQAAKRRYASTWKSEETGAIIPSNDLFWAPLNEAGEGNEIGYLSSKLPFIDPQTISSSALPDSVLWNPNNAMARTFFTERFDWLDNSKNLLQGFIDSNDFDSVLNYGLGSISGFDSPSYNLNKLLQDLNDIDLAKAQKAEKIIRENLFITKEDFLIVMNIRSRVDNENNPPSAQDWLKLKDIILKAAKQKIYFPFWVAEEYLVLPSNPLNPYPTWELKKAQLPKWRASQADRIEWKLTLEQRNRIPIVDPDLAFDENLLISNVPLNLFNFKAARVAELDTKFNDYYASIGSMDLNTVIKNALGIDDVTYLLSFLELLDEAGEDISGRIQQLGLSYPAYRRIKKLYTIYNTPGALLDEEIVELSNIFVSAFKIREKYSVWNQEETLEDPGTSLVYASLSPFFFQIPSLQDSNYGLNESTLVQWRGDYKSRRKWEKKLKARIEQLQVALDSVAKVVEEAEEKVLPILRDALVEYCVSGNYTLSEKADKLENRLLVDFKMGCCQYTTRVAHAIECLQKLIWMESVGIDRPISINGNSMEFVLEAPAFEEEWKWLGSYATWRSAMFVYIYPENLLSPTLKRKKSPAFNELIENIRGNSRLTPNTACLAVSNYLNYYNDILTLEVQATSYTKTRIANKKCINPTGNEMDYRFFSFGLAPKTNKVYFHVSDVDNYTDESCSFWMPIEGLSQDVKRINGTCLYRHEDQLHIYLFVQIENETESKFGYIRFDLHNNYWDQSVTELDLPENTDFNKIVVVQNIADDTRPSVIVTMQNNMPSIFQNFLDRVGKNWENKDWIQIGTPNNGWNKAEKILAYVELGTYDEYLVISTSLTNPKYKNKLFYRLLGPNDDFTWRSISDTELKFLTTISPKIYQSTERRINVLAEDMVTGKLMQYKIFFDSVETEIYHLNTIENLDKWMENTLDFSFKSIPLDLEYFDLFHRYYGKVVFNNSFHIYTNNGGNSSFINGGKGYSKFSECNFVNFILVWQFFYFNQQPPLNSSSLLALNNMPWPNYYETEDIATFLTNNFSQFSDARGLVEFRTSTIAGTDYKSKLKELAHWFSEGIINSEKKEENSWSQSLIYLNNILKSYANEKFNQFQFAPGSNIDNSILNLEKLLLSFLNWTVFDYNKAIRPSSMLFSFLSNTSVELEPGPLSVFMRYDRISEDSSGFNNLNQINQILNISHHSGINEFKVINYKSNFNFFISKFKTVDYNSRVYLSNDVININYRDLIFKLNDPFYPNKNSYDGVSFSVIDSSFNQIKVSISGRLYTGISEELNTNELLVRTEEIGFNWIINSSYLDARINQEYVKEVYFFLPLFIGTQLSQRGHFDHALKWFRTVYDYTNENSGQRRIYKFLKLDDGDSLDVNDYQRILDSWLIDPMNPHEIALTRRNNYFKYVVSIVAQTFIRYADSLFTLDTSESNAKAKELYEFAIDLLNSTDFVNATNQCADQLNSFENEIKCALPVSDSPLFIPIIDGIKNIKNKTDQQEAITDVLGILSTNTGSEDFNLYTNVKNAATYIGELSSETIISVGTATSNSQTNLSNASVAVMAGANYELHSQKVKNRVEQELGLKLEKIENKPQNILLAPANEIAWLATNPGILAATNPTQSVNNTGLENSGLAVSNSSWDLIESTIYSNYAPILVDPIVFFGLPSKTLTFCIPPNPTYNWLKLSAELNLFKLRNCMNIAGMKRELDPYAAPTDTVTGLPQIGADGNLVLPGLNQPQPTIYRFEFLIERAKQLINNAQQLEAAFLSALEKRDAEYYNILKAKQDISLSKANLKLKDLQIKVSEDEVDLANLQQERSEIQVEELEKMIQAGLLDPENSMIGFYNGLLSTSIASLSLGYGSEYAKTFITTTGAKITSIEGIEAKAAFGVFTGFGASKLASDISSAIIQNQLNIASVQASQARREQEWNFQKTLAEQDIRIGAQQVKIAKDRLKVVTQEKTIADIQLKNAEDSLEFLRSKFTNADLYDWMSGVLERIYSYFLNEANGVAKMAQAQLAFERQESTTSIIQDDYWEVPTDNNAIFTPGGNAPDRRGLTGSARLLQDITKLEQYALTTDKRKLQLSKTFSLSSIAPMEFEQFKETGVLTFNTLMDYFDRDFPGHYLRLVKKVKVNVIALVPASEGIKATLTSSGISRVVIGGSVFQEVIVRRSPEMVALTGTRDATGMFELQAQDGKFLNPFEGSGVDMLWQFKMPKASNLFDYNTIADIYITVEYTALQSWDYEQQVNKRLDADGFSAQRSFSLRNNFSDAWYALTHPDEFDAEEKMKVKLKLSNYDFPANVSNLAMDQLRILFLSNQSDPTQNIFSDNQLDLTINQIPIGMANLVTGTSTANEKGIISTLTNGGGMIGLLGNTPSGIWELVFSTSDEIQDLFKTNQILDIILVMDISGDLPPRS